MTSWLKRTQAGIQSAPTTPVAPIVPGSALNPTAQEQADHYNRDPNAPDARIDWERKCIYERRLPGGAYITAHVVRLQEGFYDSPSTHGDAIDNVRFLAVEFVFHPSGTVHRFRSATVTLGLHDDTNAAFTDPPKDPAHRLSAHGPPTPKLKPKFLRFAPHVLFGGVSPETLDWNFNLTGSLGVSQAPVSASVSPSGGVKTSYKLYQMMRIQGSTRTSRDRLLNGSGYDLEDGEVVWTMEENGLQRSGLPREMTFVMLITKGEVENVVFDINIEPKIASRLGSYPNWWCNILKYQPLQKEHTDLDRELGQCFYPEIPGKGYNFANLAGTFNDFVSLPGTTYSLTDQAFRNQVPVPDATTSQSNTAAAAAAGAAAGATGQGGQPQGGKGSGQPQSQPQGQSKPGSTTQTQPASSQQGAKQPSASQNEPMDYHIYLHNPRTINLHATPPPPPAAASPAPPQPADIANLPHITTPHPRPRTIAPAERTKSPMNTKMKRRSIDITSKSIGSTFSPTNSQTGIRNVSGGSLRRSRSRTDLRASPLVEDSHSSDCSQISTSDTHSRLRRPQSSKDNVPAPSDTAVRSRRPQSSKDNISSPTFSQPEPKFSGEEMLVIPMEAPSPPGGSSNMLSPPLPSSAHYEAATSKSPGTRAHLPFELWRAHSDKDKPDRKSRPRNSPSPLRKRREITPSPNQPAAEEGQQQEDEEKIDMIIPDPHIAQSPPAAVLASPQPHPPPASKLLSTPPTARSPLVKDDLAMLNDTNNSRKEREASKLRDISPYAYATANGGGSSLLDEDWDEAKGDLKRLRQRKRMSLPANAHYSYITPDDDDSPTITADREWDER